MPFLETIAGFVNDSLKAGSLNSLQPARYYGIATVMTRQNGERLELIPASCNNDGEYEAIVPDDRYWLQIYHKVISTVYTTVKNSSYGDDYAFKATSEMLLVCIADSKKVRMQAESLEPLVVYGLPGQASAALTQQTGMSRISITPLSSNTDKIMVFRQEYPASEYFLKPFQQLFSIRYRIEAAFDKNCVNKCLCS